MTGHLFRRISRKSTTKLIDKKVPQYSYGKDAAAFHRGGVMFEEFLEMWEFF